MNDSKTCSKCGVPGGGQGRGFRPSRNQCRQCEYEIKQAREGARSAARGDYDNLSVSASGGTVRRRSAPHEEFKPLVEVTRQGPVTFATLCDKLDMSPARTRDYLKRAAAVGVSVRVEGESVGLAPPEADDRVQDLKISPIAGARGIVGVISDVHAGSKYFLRAQLRDFLEYAYEQGVRDVLGDGDMIDGNYRHARFEMSHMGLDEQTRDLFETLPKKPGLRYHCITGNHEQTFAAETGVHVGRYIEGYFREHGRDDISFYGQRSAFLRIMGVVVHMWHPGGGQAYAKSYHLQKKIESYAAVKPQILLAGHWHFFDYLEERGVHAFACPTFQGEGSDFSNSLKSSPALGGLILRWDLTEQGTIRNMLLERRGYFQREKIVEVENFVGGQQAPRPHKNSGWRGEE